MFKMKAIKYEVLGLYTTVEIEMMVINKKNGLTHATDRTINLIVRSVKRIIYRSRSHRDSRHLCETSSEKTMKPAPGICAKRQ